MVNTMVEQVIRNQQDLQDFIRQIKEEKKTSVSKIENQCGLSTGSIGKWKTSSPSLSTFIKLLNYLGMELTVRPISNNSEQKNARQDSELEVMIKELLQKILKSDDIICLDKERLYNILQVFL